MAQPEAKKKLRIGNYPKIHMMLNFHTQTTENGSLSVKNSIFEVNS